MRIHTEFLDSRQLEHNELSRAVGVQLLCKIESENAVGSFKGRGADSFINELPTTVRALLTASAGNFGLALAHAGRRRGIAVTVYAAETASPGKLERIRGAGGAVKLLGRDFDEAKDHARAVAQRMKVMYVEDGREPAIAAGAGTMAMEITRWTQPIDTMLVPLGNGALLAGVGCWFRKHSPKTRIVGVCAEGAPAMAQSWRTRTARSTPSVDTIADGIAVRVPVPEALADLEGVVDDIVLVSDDAMKRALYLIYRHLGLVAEPSGVAGVAALISHSALAQGVVCTPITGGNATLDQLRAWIAKIQ
ncbi:MAG: pyridoxal-phosphate dependent enzyme [Terriglobales bacterium]